MRCTKTACVLLAALMVVAGGGVVSAQTQTKTQVFGWNLEGEVESGLRGLPQNPNGDRTPGGAQATRRRGRDFVDTPEPAA